MSRICLNGILIETNKIDDISLDDRIKNIIKGVPLTAKQIKEKINYDIDTRKFSLYLSELSFVTKEKKGNSNVFIYKNKNRQPSLFEINQ